MKDKQNRTEQNRTEHEEYSLEAEFQKIGWKAPKSPRYQYPKYHSPDAKSLHKQLRSKAKRGNLDESDIIDANTEIQARLDASLSYNEDGSINYNHLDDAGHLMVALEEAHNSLPNNLQRYFSRYCPDLMLPANVHRSQDELAKFIKENQGFRGKINSWTDGNPLSLLPYSTLMLGGITAILGVANSSYGIGDVEAVVGMVTLFSSLPLAVIDLGENRSKQHRRLKRKAGR